jgi:hypothetical protein
MTAGVTLGSLGVTRGLDTAELLDVFLKHAGTLSPFTLARLAVCSKAFQGTIKLHIKVTINFTSKRCMLHAAAHMLDPACPWQVGVHALPAPNLV